MEKLVDSGLIAAVLDMTTTEIADLRRRAACSPPAPTGSVRSPAAACRTSARSAPSTWSTSVRSTACRRSSPTGLHVHNPQVTLMRTTADENVAIGASSPTALNRCDGAVRFLLPEGGVSLIDAPGQPFHDPEADAALFDTIEAEVVPTRDRGSSGSPPTSTTRRSASACSSIRRRSSRGDRDAPSRGEPILARFRGMIERREPIVGGGAGTGSVGQVRGGRRDRPDRHLQLGPIPDGRPRFAGGPAGVRKCQRDRGRDGPRGAAGRRAHAGARRRQRHRSVLPARGLPARAAPARFAGVQNFPTVGLIDGVFRQNLEETGMGYGLEVEMIATRRRSTC